MIKEAEFFTAGINPHIHMAQGGTAVVPKIRADVKRKAALHHFRSAAAIAEEVLTSQVGPEPLPSLPSVDNLALCANRLRKNMHPPEPKDLTFEMGTAYIPQNFYRGDVKVDGRRLLIFATDHHLTLLASCKTWHVVVLVLFIDIEIFIDSR